MIPATGETFILSATNTEDNTRLDVKARSFFRDGQTAFWISHVFAKSTWHLPSESILKKAENEKKRAYKKTVNWIENGTFTSLVFGTEGAMAKECHIYHKLSTKIK